MKKQFRVCKNYEFSSIIRNQKIVKSSSFICYYKDKREDHSRIGISVGKKIGNAVHRNKVKRQVRSMVDDIFDFNEDYDSIIIVRPSYLSHTFIENYNELKDNRFKMNRRNKREKMR